MNTVIQCKDVEVRFGPVTVLQSVSFAVPERTTLCVVGPNGGGKSTLLKVILGLVRPQKGEVKVLGQSPRKSRLRVGYMPQHIHIDPLFPIDVEGIVRMGRLSGSGLGFYSKADRLATQRALEEVNLWDQRKESFINLSGGMKQRVLIARALVNDPEVLLLDEPTAMVDAHIEAKLLAHLKELHNRMTILLVSHDAAFVSNLVDEVLCVNKTAEVHPVEQVEDKALEHLYGGPVQAVIHGDHCHHGHELEDAEEGEKSDA
ncbi:MAG: metal ABC transporter ATP-binding protein [Puniceicoccaceae bacterium]